MCCVILTVITKVSIACTHTEKITRESLRENQLGTKAERKEENGG